METKFTVPEISCGHCKETIESTVNSLENVEAVNVDICLLYTSDAADE